MKMLRFTSAVMFLALVGSAAAQLLIPTPPTATLVNFDNIPLGTTQQIPFPVVTTEYTDSSGVTFAGFGQNAGGLFNPSFSPSDVPYISLPNVLYFVSAFPVVTGGLAQSPETLSFYPPILSFQFDTGSLGADCEGTSIVHAEGFDANNVSVGAASVTASLEGNTLAITFSSPASKVVVTSSHTCGSPGQLFFGVEVFSMDNIAFVPEPAAASQCVQAIIDAAGKKAKAEASCNAKALQNGVPVDPACIQKASDAFTKAFTKAQTKGDCLTDFDEGSTEAAVDTFIASAVQAVAGTSPGPDVCFGKKLTAVGKKGQSIAKCFSTAAKKGIVPDPNCGTKAANSFNGALKKCGTPTQLAPVEVIVDAFGASLNRSLTVPTTTTTTPPETTTTTTTLPPPLGEHLAFTTTAGTANCGNLAQSSPPDPPFSGELDSDTAGTTKISDLGLGCLYIGGGSATVAPSQIPEGATTILDSTDGTTLTASSGTSRADCSLGPDPTTHCITDPTVACTTDNDCTGLKGDCAPGANCFFGPPIPINGFPPSCVVNTFASDASGTFDHLHGRLQRQHQPVVAGLPDPRTALHVPELRRRVLRLGAERRTGLRDDQRVRHLDRLSADRGTVRRSDPREPDPAQHRDTDPDGGGRELLQPAGRGRRLRPGHRRGHHAARLAGGRPLGWSAACIHPGEQLLHPGDRQRIAGRAGKPARTGNAQPPRHGAVRRLAVRSIPQLAT